MNYYQHHIGDFIRDTARLTDAQSMAYLRILWMYYETEEPIKDDIDAIAFKIGANAYDVSQILSHFFFLHDDGLWHQARCDKEILAFRRKSDKAKKSASARWNNANAMRTHAERNANEPFSDANQEPVTSNQEKIKPLSGKPDDGAKELIAYLNQKTGKAFRPVDSNLRLVRARLAEGHSHDDVRAVIDRKVREWMPDAKMRQYLRPETLFGATKFNQYVGELSQPEANNEANGGSRKPSLAERATAARIEAERVISARSAVESMGADDAHVRPPLDGDFRRIGDE